MRVVVLAMLGLVWCGGAAAADGHRQLGPHQHGRGTFTIAVDGNRLLLELDAPGHDIAGFEHAAATDADRRKLADAEKALSDPLKLFVIPDAAGCKVLSAKAGLEGGHEHGHDAKESADGHAHGSGDEDTAAMESGDEGHGAHGAEHGGHHHSDFNASYELECASPENITGMTFRYFEAFAGARQLDVMIATPKGQTRAVVTRKQPQLGLGGLM